MKLICSPALLFAALLTFACGGGSHSSSNDTSNPTFEALIDQARQTPVDEPVREYASMLCDPLQKLLEAAGPALEDFATPEGTPDFGVLFEALGQLDEPFAQLVEDVRDIDPPEELEEFHQSLLAELEYGLDGLRALSSGGPIGALALPSPPPTAELPDGIEAAVIQECGPELQDVVGELGGDFFGGSSDDEFSFGETPEPVEGSIGETITHGALSLQVHSLEDPYESGDQLSTPAEGYRWVVFDVSITNVSDEEQQLFAGLDFRAKDSDGFDHAGTYIGAPDKLDSGPLAAQDSVRGQVAFEVPASAEIRQLIFDPGFFGEGRIDVELP